MNRPFDALLLSDAQLVVEVRGGNPKASMDAWPLRIFQGIGAHLDVLVDGSGEPAYHRTVTGELGDTAHALEIAGARDGKSGLNDVDVEPE